MPAGILSKAPEKTIGVFSKLTVKISEQQYQ